MSGSLLVPLLPNEILSAVPSLNLAVSFARTEWQRTLPYFTSNYGLSYTLKLTE